MASTSETGNAKNVANFEDLISFCTGYGTAYNPNKASIKLSALNVHLTSEKIRSPQSTPCYPLPPMQSMQEL